MDLHLLFGTCINFSSVCDAVSGLFNDAVLVILSSSYDLVTTYDLVTASPVLLPIKSPIVSAVFLINFFEAVLSASAANFLA